MNRKPRSARYWENRERKHALAMVAKRGVKRESVWRVSSGKIRFILRVPAHRNCKNAALAAMRDRGLTSCRMVLVRAYLSCKIDFTENNLKSSL